jgi:hypothetical protein
MKFFYVCFLFVNFILFSDLAALDFDSMPDMTFVSVNKGPLCTNYPYRGEFNSAYDCVNNVWITGFGCNDPCYSSDTYEYRPDTDAWTTTYPHYCRGSVPSDRPGGQCTFGMCFDSRAEVVLMFEGANSITRDIWAYNTVTHNWQKRAKASIMSQYEGVQIVHDSLTNATFAMADAAIYRYSYQNDNWMKLNPTGPKPPAYVAPYGWALDTRRHQILASGSGFLDGYTYIYKIAQNRFYRMTVNGATDPCTTHRTGFDYDAVNNVFIMFAGKGPVNKMWVLEMDNDTSGTWTEITGQVTNFPNAMYVGNGTTMKYDKTHNVFWTTANGHGGTYAFRYKAGGSRNITLLLPGQGRPLFTCSPNPARSSVRLIWDNIQPNTGACLLEIFNMQGRLVRNFKIHTESGQLYWDGLSNEGQQAGKGQYIFILNSSDLKLCGKTILQ